MSTPADLPQVDVIILDWNRPDDTIAAIGSALGQTGVACNVWVVDQASEPDNRARVKAFCDAQDAVSVHWLPRNVGVAAGRNIATQLGHAPFVVSLDNDAVFYDAGCIARAVSRLAADACLAAVAFRVLDAETGLEQHWDYPSAYLETGLHSFEVTRFLGGGHALRRAAFEAVGGYDEALFFAGEERDLSWRMIKAGHRLRWYRDLAILHRAAAPGKVTWNEKRYFYSVRNTLYINYKFGAGFAGFARGACTSLLRGVYNGVGCSALHGIGAGLMMSMRFALTAREHDKAACRLPEDIRRYIDVTDLRDSESSLQKLRRQFTPLL
jgi:GT2 family glycosyltransferase